MHQLPLQPQYLERVKQYFDRVKNGSFSLSSENYSDYWNDHSNKIGIKLGDDSVFLSGESGNYIPRPVQAQKSRFLARARRLYKTAVLQLDRASRLSHSHCLNTLVTYDMAYDLLMSAADCIDYDKNPFRFDPSQLKPQFKTSKEIREQWFLKERFQPNPGVYFSFYLHAVIDHFLPKSASSFLEIGAGNGNLASLFIHYNKMKGIIVDLPETILLSSCYLKSIFPDIRVLLPNEFNADTVQRLGDYDLVFVTPTQVSLLPDNCVDLSVNISSMQEMTKEQIASYFTLVQRCTRNNGIWCNNNRIEKVPSSSEAPIRAGEFPYHAGNETLVNEVDRFTRLISSDGAFMRVERVKK